MMLELKNVSFSYGKTQVLDNLSFTLQDGEILAVMGPSGCGKSTLLNLIAGLRKPSGGKILTNAEKITYVFQEPRLFPWLNVEQNLRAVTEKDEISDAELASVLGAVGLSGCERMYPSELSGGMKSRVSLARALIHSGDLFLLDEPFAALDEDKRNALGELIKQKIRERGASMILVTHQTSDAQRLADRILYLPTIKSEQ